MNNSRIQLIAFSDILIVIIRKIISTIVLLSKLTLMFFNFSVSKTCKLFQHLIVCLVVASKVNRLMKMISVAGVVANGQVSIATLVPLQLLQ